MGKTTGIIVISYDINRFHTDVKDRMQSLGYYDNWRIGSGPTYQMPNTTLWHKDKSSDAAIIDLTQICNLLGVRLEKAVAVLANEFAGV